MCDFLAQTAKFAIDLYDSKEQYRQVWLSLRSPTASCAAGWRLQSVFFNFAIERAAANFEHLRGFELVPLGGFAAANHVCALRIARCRQSRGIFFRGRHRLPVREPNVGGAEAPPGADIAARDTVLSSSRML